MTVGIMLELVSLSSLNALIFKSAGPVFSNNSESIFEVTPDLFFWEMSLLISSTQSSLARFNPGDLGTFFPCAVMVDAF